MVRTAILVAACLVLAPASALAGPGEDLALFASDLRGEAGVRARDYARMPAAPAILPDIEDPFFFELEIFAADALRLSRTIDQQGGPVDLRCIFRGMSEDASRQLGRLESAETAGEQAHIYRRIANLMRDAEDIAPAVDDTTQLPDSLPPGQCPALPG